MDKKILQSESPAERLQILKNNAETSEQFTYPKALDANELSKLKDDLTSESIKLAKLDEERKEFLTGLKSKVKPLKASVSANLQKIRSRVEEVEEEVFLMADQEEGMMGYYNAKGELVYQRVLLAEERQFRIVDESSKNTGTN
ncbi:hypothetical protein [Mesonia aquimarina]|uniref:hypothetical protein n=1 Tax=Mesonia aquimarina TaxID=1504967 RepID=UPI000EF59C06|nr:hypothetical protein [Mesonia aquimarina]